MFECFQIIDQVRRQDGRVLVHCYQGVSRSVSIAIAYLMICNDIDYCSAYAHVRFCRKVASPNVGFIMQLTNLYKQRHLTACRCAPSKAVSEKRYVAGLTDIETAKRADKSIEDIFKSYPVDNLQNAQKADIPQFYQLSVKSLAKKAERL